MPGLLLDGAVLAAASRAAVRATRNIVVVAADEVCEDAVTFTADGWVRLVIKAAGKSRSLRSKLIVSDGPLASLVEAKAAADILAAAAAAATGSDKPEGGDTDQPQSGEDATATKKGVDSTTDNSGSSDATAIAAKKTETQVVSAIAVDTKMGIAGALLAKTRDSPCGGGEYQSPVLDVPIKVDPTAAAALLAAASATTTPGAEADADDGVAAIAGRDAVAFTSSCGLSLLAGAQLSASAPSSSTAAMATPSSDVASTASLAITQTTATGRPFALRAAREHALWGATTTDAVYAALDELPLPGETKVRSLFPLAAARDLLTSLKRVTGDSSGGNGNLSSFFSSGPLTSGLPSGFHVGTTGAVLFVGCMEDGHVLSKLVHITSPTASSTATTEVTAASVATGFVSRQGPQRAARNWLVHEADAAWARGDVAKCALFRTEGIRRWPGFNAAPAYAKAWAGEIGEIDVAEVVAKERKTRVGVAVLKTGLVAVPVVVGLKLVMAIARVVSGAGRSKRDGDE